MSNKEKLKVYLDPKSINSYYIVDGKRRELRHWHMEEFGNVYVDMNRSKRCVCGVLVYFAVDENDKPIIVHKITNGFRPHEELHKKNSKN